MIVYSVVGIFTFEGTTYVEVYPKVYTDIKKASNKLKEIIETEKANSWMTEDISEDWKYNSEDILIGYSATNEYEDNTDIFIRKLDVCD